LTYLSAGLYPCRGLGACPVRGKQGTRCSDDRPRNGYALWTPIFLAIFLVSLACPTRLLGQRPFGATDIDQSAYALGSFALNVIFVESTDLDEDVLGVTEENWTDAQITNMKSEIAQTTAYWEALTSSYHPSARLDITVNYTTLETTYEPITMSGNSGSPLWINQVMNSLGYGNSYSNTLSNAKTTTRNFNNDQRDNLDTNWAATVYVVNDAADDNGKFSDDGFAFSYHGGPYVVTTYSNNGWENGRYGSVLAHELGHVFFAKDEYYASGAKNSQYAGYLHGINGNAERDASGVEVTDPPYPNALMLDVTGSDRESTYAPSPFTSVQVGHLDSDGDSIPDILDTIPILVGSSTASEAAAGIFSFSGQGTVNPLANQNTLNGTNSRSGITINTIDSAWYNLDGEGWTEIEPSGGDYSRYVEDIELELSGLTRGLHTIDLRITNSVGNHSEIGEFALQVTPEPGTLSVLCIGMLTCLRRNRKRR
jgi:hypothetical protein